MGDSKGESTDGALFEHILNKWVEENSKTDFGSVGKAPQE